MFRLASSPGVHVQLRASPVDLESKLFGPRSQDCGSQGTIPFRRFWVVNIINAFQEVFHEGLRSPAFILMLQVELILVHTVIDQVCAMVP